MITAALSLVGLLLFFSLVLFRLLGFFLSGFLLTHILILPPIISILALLYLCKMVFT